MNHWHLDRRIPIALILTIAIQTGAGIWWASSINERVANNEKRIDERNSQETRLVRLESDIGYVKESLNSLTADTRAIREALERISRNRPN